MGDMAKKAGGKLAAGARIRVKEGVMAPEFPDLSMSGWTGTIAETSGKKADPKFIIEWDDATLGGMPPDYLKKCEEQQLYFKMACLRGDEIEPAAE